MKNITLWRRHWSVITTLALLVVQLISPAVAVHAAATAAASNIVATPQSTSADISLYIMNGGYYKVEYGLTGSYGSVSSQGYVTSTPWGPVGTALTGLTPNTTYSYRVKAWPLATPSPTEADITYSSNYTFTTTARDCCLITHWSRSKKIVFSLIEFYLNLLAFVSILSGRERLFNHLNALHPCAPVTGRLA